MQESANPRPTCVAKPAYGQSLGSPRDANKMERWFPIFEKAYAQFKGGSYETIGQGESARYNGTGIHANHACSVLGTIEENGTRFVQLRNPWFWPG